MRVVVARMFDRVHSIRPTVDHLTKEIDSMTAHMHVRVAPQHVENQRHNIVFAGTAGALLAAITGQRMQRARSHPRVCVLESRDQLRNCGLIDEVIQHNAAAVPNRRIRMLQTTTEGWRSIWSRFH